MNQVLNQANGRGYYQLCLLPDDTAESGFSQEEARHEW